jgi:hypothetical protein
MADGVKPTRIEAEGYPLPDEVSIDGDYTGDDVDWDSSPGMLGYDQWKQPVRCATTASITIATALNAGDTLDGVTLAAGDRVLVKDQGTHNQNGIYVAGATPARAADMDEDAEVLGAVVYVIDGGQAGTGWAVTNVTAPLVGTDAIDWAAFGGGGTGGGITVADEGTPLATTATTLDFVGAGVVASGTGATKTITISGASVSEITDIPTAETDTSLVLSPDGMGGVAWAAAGGGPGSAPPAVSAAALIHAYTAFR